MENTKHNGIISFWKFMFTLLIIIGHIAPRITSILGINLPLTNTFRASSIGVEFFFIVSGYLMTKKAMKTKINNNSELGVHTFNYIWKKIKHLFPYMFISYFIALIINISIFKYPKYVIVNTIWDILFLRMSGINYNSNMLGVAWYISAMLICMIILYPLIIKYKDNFIYIIAPINVIFIGGFIAHTYGNIADPSIWTGLVYKSLLRAFFELSLGSIAYSLSKKINSLNFTDLGKFAITCIELFGYLSIFFLVNLLDAHNKYDFIMIFILFICISISFSKKSLLQQFSDNKCFYYLESLSLSLYLNQIWIMETFLIILKKFSIININYYVVSLCIVIITIIISIITNFIVTIIKNNYSKLKSFFIVQE